MSFVGRPSATVMLVHVPSGPRIATPPSYVPKRVLPSRPWTIDEIRLLVRPSATVKFVNAKTRAVGSNTDTPPPSLPTQKRPAESARMQRIASPHKPSLVDHVCHVEA